MKPIRERDVEFDGVKVDDEKSFAEKVKSKIEYYVSKIGEHKFSSPDEKYVFDLQIDSKSVSISFKGDANIIIAER